MMCAATCPTRGCPYPGKMLEPRSPGKLCCSCKQCFLSPQERKGSSTVLMQSYSEQATKCSSKSIAARCWKDDGF
jgi:hypothetical protein